MNQHARQSYLEAQVMTATPQRLRLMLIEGAIRNARLTLRHWEQEENDQALQTLIRCRDIVSELLGSIRADHSELTKRVAGLYLFVFQQLTTAQLRRDTRLVEDAISVLEVERETWRQVCEQMPVAPPPPADGSSAGREITAAGEAIRDDDRAGDGFSCEA